MENPVAELLVSQAETISRLFGGLSTPTRLRILGWTSHRSLTVKELVMLLQMTQPHICRQLQLLCELNLLIRTSASNGGRADSYRANPALVLMATDLARLSIDQRPDS